MKKHSIATYYVVLCLTVVGCSIKNKIPKINNELLKSVEQVPQKISVLKRDSTNSYFGIKGDIIYSDKVYPPKDSKYDEKLGTYNSSSESEALASKNAVLSCFSKERYQELVNLKAAVLMHIYTDEKGIIKEVVLITTNNNKHFTDNEMVQMINKMKGMKITIPPAFINFSYFECHQVVWFK